MTPIEYSQNRGNGEWETEYPNWKDLTKAIDQTIQNLNDNYDVEEAELLIQVLAIDNESEITLDKISISLIEKVKFVEQVICSNQPQAKWQIVELLGDGKLANATQNLVKLIEDKDKYVIRRALLSLNRIDSSMAKLFAKNSIQTKMNI